MENAECRVLAARAFIMGVGNAHRQFSILNSPFFIIDKKEIHYV